MFIKDEYDTNTHGEDGLLTRDEMIERDEFSGEFDEDEARQMRVNALLSSSKQTFSTRKFMVNALCLFLSGVLFGALVAACFLMDNADLAWVTK